MPTLSHQLQHVLKRTFMKPVCNPHKHRNERCHQKRDILGGNDRTQRSASAPGRCLTQNDWRDRECH
jgi:hypothetical protein